MPDESSLHQLFEEIVAAENRGDVVDRNAIIAQHPEFSDQLRGFFAHHDLYRGMNTGNTADIDTSMEVKADINRGDHRRHSKAVKQPATNVNGVVGLCFAAVGVLGWFLTVSMIQDIGYYPKTGDGQRDLINGFGNILVFLLRSIGGLIGSILFGGSCVMGLVISLLGLNQHPKWYAGAGVILGLTGFAIWAWSIAESVSHFG